MPNGDALGGFGLPPEVLEQLRRESERQRGSPSTGTPTALTEAARQLFAGRGVPGPGPAPGPAPGPPLPGGAPLSMGPGGSLLDGHARPTEPPRIQPSGPGQFPFVLPGPRFEEARPSFPEAPLPPTYRLPTPPAPVEKLQPTQEGAYGLPTPTAIPPQLAPPVAPPGAAPAPAPEAPDPGGQRTYLPQEGVAGARLSERPTQEPSGRVEEARFRLQEEQFQQRQAQRRGLATGLRNIAEGFGNIRFPAVAYIPGRGPVDMTDERPLYAEGLRDVEAAVGDEMSPYERDLIKRHYGIDLPPGMEWGPIRQILPAIASTVRESGRNLRHRERMELGGKRESRNAEIAYLKEGRAARTEKRIPAIDARKLTTKRWIINQLEATVDKFSNEEFRGKLGPVWGRWQKVARLFGIADAGAIADYAQFQIVFLQYMNQTIGSQMTPEEMSKLKQVLPQAEDSPETFIAVLRQFIDSTRSAYEEDVNALRRLGRSTDGWYMPRRPPAEETRETVPSGTAGGGAGQRVPAGSQTIRILVNGEERLTHVAPVERDEFNQKFEKVSGRPLWRKRE